MKAAILGNGPSRVSYTNPWQYDYVLGCNIPWTKVDATIVVDIEVIMHLSKHPEKITKMYASANAWRYTDEINKRHLFDGCLLKIIEKNHLGESSAHIAAKVLIGLGYTEIDIYGCDTKFGTSTTESYTHQYVNTSNDDQETAAAKWRKRWVVMQGAHPEIKFKFIK